MMERIGELNDRVKSARFSDKAYIDALNDVISGIVKDRTAPLRQPAHKYSVQSCQRVRDELYTLIPDPSIAAVSNSLAARPADYFYYLLLWVYVDGVKQFCHPTSYNEEGPLGLDPFAKPNTEQIYFNEKADGFRILKGDTGTFGNYELWYIKNPAVVSIGQEKNKIVDGGAIASGDTYYVYDQSEYDGIIYYPGDTFVGTATATLTSGTVINGSFIVNCDLPENMDDEICTAAGANMELTIEDYNKTQFLNKVVEES